MKDEKLTLQKSNLSNTDRMDGAVKDYDEVRKVII